MKKINKTNTDIVAIKEQNQVSVLRDPNLLKPFLEQPKLKIAEFITGALSNGLSDWTKIGGRLVQGVIVGNLMTQVGREINKLIDEGKIKENYAETKYGFKSLEELLKFIDSEAPDEDRFNAVKAMFFALNSVDVKNLGEEILRYQLFHVSTKLSSSQLLTMRAAYEFKKNHTQHSSAEAWLQDISKQIGHNSKGLVENDETVLEQEKLITGRTYNDRSGVRGHNGRLSDFGISLVEYILKYENYIEE